MDATALLCNICPKLPRFSDVSHLLTHVSSKAHLSHYFKLQVRSHQEPQAVDLLDEYDRWYKANNLAQLLSDRMASKEARKRKSQVKAVAQGATLSATRNTDGQPILKNAGPSPHTSLPDFLDPRLSDPYFHMNQLVGSADPSPPAGYVFPSMPSVPDSKASVRAHAHHPLPPAVSREKSVSTPWKRDHDLDSDDETGSILQATPVWRGGTDQKAELSSSRFARGTSSDPFVDGNGNGNDLLENGTDKERADEMARLKGVLWPGMDIFDSATEQMRRKRNQKKDESILKMMEKTSMCVEQTELVFSPTGILRKQRFISGNVEDSSPLKGETPIPKRRAVRPKRGLLSQTDANVGPRRDQERKRAKKAVGHGPKLPPEESSRHVSRNAGSPATHFPMRYRGGYYSSDRSFENDGDFQLTLKALDQKPCGGFAVFQEEQPQPKFHFKDHRSGEGARLGAPASSHAFYPRREAMTFGTLPRYNSSSYPSNFAGRSGYHPAEKENIEPILNVNGRIEPLDGWNSPFAKRTYAADTGYPPQYFFNDAQRTGFGPFDGQEPSGYSCNPLTASFARLPAQENRMYAGNTAPNQEVQSVPRAASSDATISEVEQDDFERLYLDGSAH